MFGVNNIWLNIRDDKPNSNIPNVFMIWRFVLVKNRQRFIYLLLVIYFLVVIMGSTFIERKTNKTIQNIIAIGTWLFSLWTFVFLFKSKHFRQLFFAQKLSFNYTFFHFNNEISRFVVKSREKNDFHKKKEKQKEKHHLYSKCVYKLHCNSYKNIDSARAIFELWILISILCFDYSQVQIIWILLFNFVVLKRKWKQ